MLGQTAAAASASPSAAAAAAAVAARSVPAAAAAAAISAAAGGSGGGGSSGGGGGGSLARTRVAALEDEWFGEDAQNGSRSGLGLGSRIDKLEREFGLEAGVLNVQQRIAALEAQVHGRQQLQTGR